MKTLIFSDTHLSSKFDPKLFEVLSRIINDADKVIINGDFWDFILTDWDDFVNSEWKKLFPILKSKEAFYIYGNHDKAEFMDDRVHAFCVERGYSYEIYTAGHKLMIQHGNLIVIGLDERFPFLVKLRPIVKLANIFYRNLFLLVDRRWFNPGFLQNRAMRKWAKKTLEKNEILVCGHSHTGQFDPGNSYINTGMIRYGIVQYLVIDEDKLIFNDYNY